MLWPLRTQSPYLLCLPVVSNVRLVLCEDVLDGLMPSPLAAASCADVLFYLWESPAGPPVPSPFLADCH